MEAGGLFVNDRRLRPAETWSSRAIFTNAPISDLSDIETREAKCCAQDSVSSVFETAPMKKRHSEGYKMGPRVGVLPAACNDNLNYCGLELAPGGVPTMEVNDNACNLDQRVALESCARPVSLPQVLC